MFLRCTLDYDVDQQEWAGPVPEEVRMVSHAVTNEGVVYYAHYLNPAVVNKNGVRLKQTLKFRSLDNAKLWRLKFLKIHDFKAGRQKKKPPTKADEAKDKVKPHFPEDDNGGGSPGLTSGACSSHQRQIL